jgi:hypothetical protein
VTALKATDNAADVNSLASAEVLLGTTTELSRTGVDFGTVVRPVAGVLAAALLFSGCGGGDSPYGGGGAPATYSIGGKITGLRATGLVLANGSDTVSPAAGATSFTFAAALASGSNYSVTVKTQPGNEMCQVANGGGQVGSAAVTNVMVTCAAPATYSIGGTITGLTAAGLVLANGSDTVSPAAGATSFKFATALTSGSSYAVTVKTQPKNEMCQVANGSGQVGSAAVTNMMVTCTRVLDWAWLSGSSTVHAKGVYGTRGVAAPSNVPGARNGSFSWTDNVGNLWLFGGDGYDSVGTQALLNDLWRYSPGTGQWTWVSGSNVAGRKGVYGTLGVAVSGNVPGARTSSVSWTDSAGNLWLFGGQGIDSTGASGYLNDVWRFSPRSGQWTWVGGSSTANAKGAYGTQGISAPGNVPGARERSVSWTDGAGNLWLFGGNGYNDLWRYGRTGQWVWVNGSSTGGAGGVYGTQGISAPGNGPGARGGSISWTDGAGQLWLFGGLGYDSTGLYGFLNDLWRYSPDTDQWTWVNGSSTLTNAMGVYGTLGIAAPGNVPRGRISSVSWTDSEGNLWLFGGRQGFGFFNDLWRYSVGTGEWTWVGGSSTGPVEGVYGTLGIGAAGNVPGARFASISWTDSAGKLWLFGGIGWDSTGTPGDLNDLWVY